MGRNDKGMTGKKKKGDVLRRIGMLGGRLIGEHVQMARDKLFLHGEKARHCRKHLDRAGSGDRGLPALSPGRTLFSTRSRSPPPRTRSPMIAAVPSPPAEGEDTHFDGLGEACLPGPAALQGKCPSPRAAEFFSPKGQLLCDRAPESSPAS
jgi:hypothetical protein